MSDAPAVPMKGDGSLRASPSVPTEGHEAAVLAAAKALNGSEYGSEGTSQLWAEMRTRGLVAVFGASDDLMEFRGAIDDELSAYGGTTALVTPEGLFEPCEARCKAGREARQAAVPIEAMWDNDGYSWTYKTDVPHATFDVIEDGEPYCRGIVFALADAKPTTGSEGPSVGIGAADEPKTSPMIAASQQAVSPPEGVWRPIETAPKDGTHFLAREDGGDVFRAAYHEDGYLMSFCGQPVVHTPDPTHWMPLPPAPSPTAGDE